MFIQIWIEKSYGCKIFIACVSVVMYVKYIMLSNCLREWAPGNDESTSTRR